MRPGTIYHSLRTIAAMAVMIAGAAPWSPAQDGDEDLFAISLENLLNVKVTSVSRHVEELRSTAAAVHVITQEDIRRSGASDVADLLRGVPGLQVAQINSSTWAVSSRGFNAEYATKLLVLVDDRTVYDPTFSGVYWHMQNLILEDIERIEVIRGPGATMWGSNAVNGVISIRTKNAKDTVGGRVVAEAGSDRPGAGSFRFGDSLGSKAFYRVFGRQTTRAALETQAGANGGDSWNFSSAGLRVDWAPTSSDSFTFEGELHRGVRGSLIPQLKSLAPLTYETAGSLGNRGGYFRSQWNHAFGANSDLTFRFYVNHSQISDQGTSKVQSVDFDFQHRFQSGRHEIVWGLARRETNDRFADSMAFGLTPSEADTDLTSAFAQDTIAFFDDALQFTVGSKLEHSTLTGYNVQPGARVSWLAAPRHSIWASVAKAVHTASRIERGMHLNIGAFQAGPFVSTVELFGQPDTRSEDLTAFEAGYRYQANRRLWTDVAAFYNVYDHLSNVETGAPTFTTSPPPAHMVLPLYFRNNMSGRTYGFEAAASYKLNDRWTLKGTYSLLHMGLMGPGAEDTEGQSPRHQGYAGVFMRLSKSVDFSGHAYFVGGLSSFNVPGYVRADAALTWTAFENLELSLTGQNLGGSHLEWGALPSPSNIVKPSAYGRVAWKF